MQRRTSALGVVRRIARRVLRRASTPERIRLTLRQTESLAILEGELSEGVVVEALQAKVVGAVPARDLTFPQDPSSRFSFELDLADLYAKLGTVEGSFDFYVNVRGPGGIESWRLGNFAETHREQAVDAVAIGGTAAWLHITGQGNVSLHFRDEMFRRIKTTPLALRTGGARIEFDMTVETYSRPVDSMVGIWVGRQSSLRREFEVTVVDLVDRRRAGSGLYAYDVRGSFSPADLLGGAEVADDIVDPHVEVRMRGVEEPVRARILRPPRRLSRTREVVVPMGDARQVLVPFFTFRGKRLAFSSERFEAADLAFMRRLRWVSWAFFVLRPALGIWLVGEVPYKAQDNGFAFFRWLRTTRPDRRAYYVIERDSPDRARVEAYGNVLLRHSRKHVLYSMLASRFVSSHHAEYLYASRISWMQRRCRGLRVFLQHGVISTKNLNLNYGRRKMAEGPFDRFLVSSDVERQIVIQELEYLPSQVVVTGLARFDTLLADDVPVQPRILIMPTWRDWLGQRGAFEESEFLERWRGFLSHPELARLAADHDLSIELVLHPNMLHYAELFEVSGVTVHPMGADIQHLLKSGSVLVTDYSSVHWDFSFLQKPVLYFQFDRDRFIGDVAAYVDFATQFPGDIAFDEDRLVAMLRDVVDGGMRMSDEHRDRSRAFLKHRDRRSCERVYDEVSRPAGLRTRATRIRNARVVRTAYVRFRTSSRYHRTVTWVYRFSTMLPKRALVVFESDHGASYGGQPRALYERLLERGTALEIAVVNDTPIRLPDLATRKLRRLSPRYYWDLGRARYWVFNQNTELQFKPGRGTYFLQTWHGTPLKKMQRDVPVMLGRRDGYHDRVRRMVSYWDALVSPSPFATEAYRSAFGFEGPIIESGYPANDLLLADDVAERAEVVRRRLGIDTDRRVVLYAPTFRDDRRKGRAWAADMMLDLRKFVDKLGDDTTLLVRFHPIVVQKIGAEFRGKVLDVSKYPDTGELLIATDVLITDYSSIMFDFAHTGRQTLFFTYDLESYRDDLRGFYFDFEAAAPGPLLSTSAEVIEALSHMSAITAQYAHKREAFRERFGPNEDGHASDRVLDALLGPDGAGPVT